jgi:transcription elongation factor Elf1
METFTIICDACGDSNETYLSLNPVTMEITVNCGNCDNEEVN